MRPATDRYAYGPCSSPCAHRHPSFPHLRRCSASDPARNPAAPGREAASRSRRDRSSAEDSARRSLLCAFITQETASQDARSQRHHPACRVLTAATTAARSARTSYVSGPAASAGTRSVHASGIITDPSGPPSQLTASPSGVFRSNSTRSRCPDRGWNGCVTVTNDSGTSRSLRDRAVCGFRGNTETTQFSVRLRYHLLPNRGRRKGLLLQPETQILQERLHPDRPFDGASGLPVNPGRPGTLVRRDPVPGHPQERRVADEIEQIIKPAAPIGHRPTVQLGLQFRYP